MAAHYCIIARDCKNCPLKKPDYWCPAEKLEPFWLDFIEDDEKEETWEGSDVS